MKYTSNIADQRFQHISEEIDFAANPTGVEGICNRLMRLCCARNSDIFESIELLEGEAGLSSVLVPGRLVEVFVKYGLAIVQEKRVRFIYGFCEMPNYAKQRWQKANPENYAECVKLSRKFQAFCAGTDYDSKFYTARPHPSKKKPPPVMGTNDAEEHWEKWRAMGANMRHVMDNCMIFQHWWEERWREVYGTDYIWSEMDCKKVIELLRRVNFAFDEMKVIANNYLANRGFDVAGHRVMEMK